MKLWDRWFSPWFWTNERMWMTVDSGLGYKRQVVHTKRVNFVLKASEWTPRKGYEDAPAESRIVSADTPDKVPA